MRRTLLFLIYLLSILGASAQLEVRTEAQLTATDGDYTPLWLNANRYGLSSLDKTNGYVRAGLFRPMAVDSLRRWDYAFGADVALTDGFTSRVVVQQAYGELRWLKGVVTLGSKEQPLELKNQELSSGSQTLGVNARPVPMLRLSLPDYWAVPGTKGFLGLKGHVAYGFTTDDNWQTDFCHRQSKYSKNTMLHTKAAYLRLGKPGKPFSAELGLEMGCQFAGTGHKEVGLRLVTVENEKGLSSMWHAFVPGGGEASEDKYRNEEGNHLGSWVARLNLDYDSWGVSVYADHFFEDQSQMFFLDFDGYGEDEQWDSWEHFRWLVYDLRDMQLGVELRLKQCRWVDAIVAEYLYTKYQSGAIYHDHTQTMADHVGGLDGYYYHDIFTGWQHWGQVMGNPLYKSPIYNNDGRIDVSDSRFWAWHFGVSGSPLPGLRYRLLTTWQRGFGTYRQPYVNPRDNFSLMAEASYSFPEASALHDWSLRAAVGMDRGQLLGHNTGVQLTIGRRLQLTNKR